MSSRITSTFSALLLLSLSCAVCKADTCGSVVGNFVQNCGFENGTTSSTIGGHTNDQVPSSWTPNYGYDLEASFNHLTSYSNSGTYGLSIGNYENEPVPTLSQTFADLNGGTYSGLLYVAYGAGMNNGDTGAFFDVQVDGANVLALDQSAFSNYAPYSFSFTGTGSDTLTLAGNLTHSEWFVDDVSVTGPAAGAPLPSPTSVTPEPTSLALLSTGLLGLGGVARKRFGSR